MIEKRHKDTDIASEIAQGRYLKKRIIRLADDVANLYLANEGSLNKIIADIAKQEDFNRLQIQRLVEEVNTVVFNKLYRQKQKDNDRRIVFDLAELAGVVEVMGLDAPPEIDNPNYTTGRPGEGEIAKTASTHASIHNPNAYVEEMRQALAEKKASEERLELEKLSKELNQEIESGIFKIAQSIVRSESYYRNGNQLYNTLLSEVGFDDALSEGISKKASEITDFLKETRRVPSNFMLSLTVEPQEKVASTLFGERSLLKQANTDTKLKVVEQPKVAPIQNVEDFEALINLAQKIQKTQSQALEVDQKLHGGAK